MEETTEHAVPNTGWSKSTDIGDLVGALASAQLEFDPVLKDANNPAYHSKYADLAGVISATQPHLAKHGLTVIQLPKADLGNGTKLLTLTTVLAHKSGQWISSDLSLPAMMRERFDAQSIGSAVTYARRYAYQAIIGVAAEQDDDGNHASGVGSKDAQQEVVKRKLDEAKAAGKNVGGIEFFPDSAGMIQLRGTSDVAVLRANMPQPLLDLMVFLPNAKCWAVPVENGMQIFTLAQSHKIDCHISNENFKKLEQMAELIATAEKKR